MQVLVINPGATSTKIAVFDDGKNVFAENITHTVDDLAPFESVVAQMPYRKKLIAKLLADHGYKLQDFAAICGRGGLFRHIPSGTYLVDDDVIKDILQPTYGEHAANLGAYISKELADEVGIKAFFVDPVCVDEMSEVARISGLEGIERQSFFHALNQKSIARKTAAALGKKYEACNLIVCHMGGGVSVAAHQKGLVTDVFNVKDDGAMGMDRGGGIPVNAVINLCFSGKSKAEIKKLFGNNAGVASYLGTKDFKEVERRAFDDKETKARLIFDAFVYQIIKDIGAMAAVLKFQIDAIAYTGGMAHSERLVNCLNAYVGKLAPVYVFPGENEMQSLADGAFNALNTGKYKIYANEVLK